MKLYHARSKAKINKVCVIACIWVMIAVIITLYDNFCIRSQISAGTSPSYSFLQSLSINTAAAFAGAILGGGILVFYVNERFRDKPYWISIMLVALFLVVVFTLLMVLVALAVSLLQTGKSFTHPDTQRAFNDFLFNYTFFKNMLVWSVITALTQLILHVNDKFGPHTLWNFIRGKYHVAREETRIFMFVDLHSSTTIAETLGNEKYHNLLRDFYADMTNPIIYNKGEIYQYVGDEVIISWQLPAGRTNNHCLKCYFDMQERLAELKEKYTSKYGVVPDFKAGLHYGKVIAGEIGIIKREITFSGDVMNTTSRIQSKCNEHSVKILSSDELLQMLSYHNDYLRIPIGDVALKGKEGKIALSTLQIRS